VQVGDSNGFILLPVEQVHSISANFHAMAAMGRLLCRRGASDPIVLYLIDKIFVFPADPDGQYACMALAMPEAVDDGILHIGLDDQRRYAAIFFQQLFVHKDLGPEFVFIP
jgi:hypothetical protein